LTGSASARVCIHPRRRMAFGVAHERPNVVVDAARLSSEEGRGDIEDHREPGQTQQNPGPYSQFVARPGGLRRVAPLT